MKKSWEGKKKGKRTVITIWNRKELFTTFSMSEQARIRELLKREQLEYRLHTVSRLGGTRGQLGTSGMDLDSNYSYTFYVKRKEYEKGRAIIHC